MRPGDLVRLKDKVTRAVPNIALWENENLTYPSGRYPCRSIHAGEVCLVLEVRDVLLLGSTVWNTMLKVHAHEGVGWITQEIVDPVAVMCVSTIREREGET